MARELVETGFPGSVPKGDDARRTILEIDFQNCSFQTFLIKSSSEPTGQHFHRNKFEVFHFLKGGGVIRTAEVDAKGKIIGEIRGFDVAPGFTIKIPSYHTHRFDLQPGTKFVCFSSAPFDPGDLVGCPIK